MSAESKESTDPRAPIEPKPANLAKTLDEMEAVLGKLEQPSEPVQGDLVRTALHLVLCRGLPSGYGQEALRRIDEEFVDRNELRVTEAYEVEDLLADLEIPDLFERCRQLRDVVAEVYNDQNAVDLDFLREASVSDRSNFFARVPALDPELAGMISHLVGWEEVLFSGRSTQRVQARLGLEPKDAKHQDFVEKLAALLTPFGHIPIRIGPDGKNGKAVTEPPLCPASILLRVSPAPKGRKRS